MAAPSSASSSCEIVDLAVAATLGDATSHLFFSGGGGGGGGDDLSWPEAAAFKSTLTNEASLVALRDKFGLPKELKPVRAADTGCAAACDTPPTEGRLLCIHSDALEAGLRFPMPEFYRRLLRHYGLAPSQLTPNSWAYMAAFVLRCREADEEPRVSVFRYFFSLCAQKHKDRPTGWHHFRPFTGRPSLFSGNLKAKRDWRSRFLFLEPPKGMQWGCPLAWGKPKKKSVGIVELTDETVKKLENMPCIDLMTLLERHGPPVGALNLLAAPIPKPECAAARARAPSLTLLQAALEAGARDASAADEGDDSTRRKRMRPGPSCPAAVTPQSHTISAAPPSLQGMEVTPFDGAWGRSSSEISLPPGITLPQGMGMTQCEISFDGAWGSSSSETFLPLPMYDAVVTIEAEKARLLQDKQQAAQDIAYLKHKLQEATDREREARAMNAKFMGYWAASRAENEELKEKYTSEIAKLNQERASEVAKLLEKHADEIAKLKDEHHKASTAHAEKAKAERTAEIAKLQEKHADELARVKHDAEEVVVEVVQDTKKDIALALFPHLDASLLNKFLSKNLH